MALDLETLWWLLDRTYSNNKSLFWSLWIKHSKIILWKFFPIQRSGMSTSFLWDLSFLSGQIFPDTTSGEFTGIPAVSVLKGFIYTSLAEKWYYTSNHTHLQKRFYLSMGEGKGISQRLKLCHRWELTAAIELDFAPWGVEYTS